MEQYKQPWPRVVQPLRRLAMPVADVLLVALGLHMAFDLRFDGHIPVQYIRALPGLTVIWVAVRLGWLAFFRMYGRVWRYASIAEVISSVMAVSAGAVTLYALNYLAPYASHFSSLVRVPRSIFAIEGILAVFLLGGVRLSARMRETVRLSWQDIRPSALVARLRNALAAGVPALLPLPGLRGDSRPHSQTHGEVGPGVGIMGESGAPAGAGAGAYRGTDASAIAGTPAKATDAVPVLHARPAAVALAEAALGHAAASQHAAASAALAAAPRPRQSHRPARLLIVGAGDAGAMALREIRNGAAPHWNVVGFIDDDPGKHGRRLMGVPILGDRYKIPVAVSAHAVEEILIAMPSASRQDIREIVAIARQTGCRVQTLPALHELIDGRVTVNQIRPVRIEDLLGREAVRTDLSACSAYLSGRTVLVTGAGGSIGSELCRQIARFQPGRLVLLGHGENSIFAIDGELRRTHPGLRLDPVIADIRDRAKMDRVFDAFRPAVVFHAAAHKHVPLMEANPDEAVSNNVFGTRNLVDAAARVGVERFVMISTDKAVHPVNAMGCSKRIAEMIVQNANGKSRTRFVAVRFGNVLGSRGSVIPLFEQQIARGGPVTVTHPEMRRYFMTIPEAVQLVIEAGALGEGGEIFLLNMGEPVRILDLAYDMIRLSGFEPGVDIPIVFTGPRPGEKLFEELRTDGEDVLPTRHPQIVKLRGLEVDEQWLEEGLRELEQALAVASSDGCRRVMLQIAEHDTHGSRRRGPH